MGGFLGTYLGDWASMSVALVRGWRLAGGSPRSLHQGSKSWLKLMAASGVLAEIIGSEPMRASEFYGAVKRYAEVRELIRKPGKYKYIYCDAKLKELFEGADTIELGKTHQYIRKHLLSPEEVAAKTAEQKTNDTETKGKQRQKTGLTALRKLSPALAEICGTEKITWPHALRAIWLYAKEKGLKNGSHINCDDKLKQLSNGASILHFKDLRQLLQAHTKKI